MNVQEFDRRIEAWAGKQIGLLPECNTIGERLRWAGEAREEFRTVARETRVPLNKSGMASAEMAIEALHLQWVVAANGEANAAIVLEQWARVKFLPQKMTYVPDSREARAAMQRASVEQYGPSVPPVREVMRLCFPDVEDGCTLHLYTSGQEGNFAYSMSNGDCVGVRHECHLAFESDEWAVGMFEFMEAFYRFVQEMPS